MIVIYHCFGSAHSSVLAAAIHTGMLPLDRIPDNKEIINLPRYDKTSSRLLGTVFYYGRDEHNNRIYIMGTGKATSIVLKSFNNFLKLEHINENEIIMVNTLKYINIYVRIGGFLSRGLGLIFPGRYLTVYGLKRCYPDFVKIVTGVKKKLGIA